jgi:hypothetical protein
VNENDKSPLGFETSESGQYVDFNVEEVHVLLSRDPDGNEGMVGLQGPDGPIPALVTSPGLKGPLASAVHKAMTESLGDKAEGQTLLWRTFKRHGEDEPITNGEKES